MLEVNVKIIIIVVIIIILFISGYNKINTDTMTDDDLMNLYIMAQLNSSSTDDIKDYKFMTSTGENIVYENDDTIKFYILGTNKLYDVNICDALILLIILGKLYKLKIPSLLLLFSTKC